MNIYDQKQQFANKLGFKTPGRAIAKLSLQKFNEMFQNKETLNIQPLKEKKPFIAKIKHKKIKKHQKKSRRKLSTKPKIDLTGSIVLENINSHYRLYPDGKIFSTFYNKVLKPYKLTSKGKFTPHYSYYLTFENKTKKSFQVGRLVKFYFGKHNYKKIEKMPKLMYVDGNTKNYSDENLKFDLNNEVIKKVAKTRTSDHNCKIKNTELQNMKHYLKVLTYKQIAAIYKVSDMSVSRFVKRHNLK